MPQMKWMFRARGLLLTGSLLTSGLIGLGAFLPVSSPVQAQAPEVEPVEPEPVGSPPASGADTLKALDTIPVPLPSNLNDFITNRSAAIELGKALFWDVQAGGDGDTACASCHFHAGVDNRTKNTLNPGSGPFRGANAQLNASDFPFHRLRNPDQKPSDNSSSNDNSNPTVFDTGEVVGSQGVDKTTFRGINDVARRDRGDSVPDGTFNAFGVNNRQVTGRNTPSIINAIYNDRNFWDGRANHFFNGVNPFGDMDPDAKIWVASSSGALSQIRILLNNGSAASQAVGPPNNDVEMSWDGRTFPELGRKMLALRPLFQQKIHAKDSVLGRYADGTSGFRDQNLKYAALVKSAFPAKYWNSSRTTPDGFTLMEQNFSLFWGLSIMMYESTLVSGDSPFDRFAKGDESALTAEQKEGLRIFTHEGQCSACHSGPEFTGATVSERRHSDPLSQQLIEKMLMGDEAEAFYDGGFYNIGVRPTADDLGVGGAHPTLGPWSYSRRKQQGRSVNLSGQSVSIGPNDRLAVNGAFKTPTLRNIELTGPYMHNGGMRTLTEVVKFYARGTDFHKRNRQDIDPDVSGIEEIRGDEAKIQAVVAFLKSLTDDRVRRKAAPFDHPSIAIYAGARGAIEGQSIEDGIILPAVGKNGTTPIKPFDEVLK